jgi:hypothetical protein
MRTIALISAIINLLTVVIWVINTADPLLHWDGIQYFNAYTSVTLTESYNHVGRFPEILLQYIYFGLYKIKSDLTVTQIIIFNGCLAGCALFIFHVCILLRLNKRLATMVVLISCVATSPGIGMQLSRQAISVFLVAAISVLLLSRGRFSTLPTIMLTALTHHGSIVINILNSIFLKNNIRVGIIFGILAIILIVSIADYFKLNYQEFLFQPNKPFSVLSYNVLFILAFIILFLNKLDIINKPKILAVMMITMLLSIFPNFFFKRVFFAIELTVIPYVLGILASSLKQNFNLFIAILTTLNFFKLILLSASTY